MRSSEFDECRACVCFAVRKAARAVTQHYDRALRPYGLRAPQFNLLAMLAQTGPLPMVKLAEWLGLDRTSLTRNLRRPAEKHWLSITEDSDDARIRNVAITPNGIAMLHKVMPSWREAQAGVGPVLARAGLKPITAKS